MMLNAEMKKKLLEQLASEQDEASTAALKVELGKITLTLHSEQEYAKLSEDLDLLGTIAFRFPAETMNTISVFLDRLATLHITHTAPEGFPEGYVDKYQTPEKLVIGSLEILSGIRYADFDQIPKLLGIQMHYALDERADVAKAAQSHLRKMGKFNMRVYDHPYPDKPGYVLGPRYQDIILDYLEQLPDADRIRNHQSVCLLCEEMLSPLVREEGWTYNTYTWTNRHINASEVTATLRNRCLELLKKQFWLPCSVKEKKGILSSMEDAASTPHTGNYSDDLLNLIRSNIVTILNFYLEIVDKLTHGDIEELDLLMQLEHNAYWHYRRMNVPEVRDAALAVKDKIDACQEYGIYKTLIGFNGVFGTWGSSSDVDGEVREERKIREERLEALLASVDASDHNLWTKRILSYAQIKSDDLATFPMFGQFLQRVSALQPHLGLRWLQEHADELNRFIPAILDGIISSNKSESAFAVIEGWIREGRFLAHSAKALQHLKTEYPAIIRSIAQAAICQNDNVALMQIIATLVTGYTEQRKELVGEILPAALDKLVELGDYAVAAVIWYMPEKDAFIEDLSREHAEKLLDTLRPAPAIRHELEWIIASIARVYPEAVMDFIVSRVKQEENGGSDRFDAIPYTFYALGKALAGQHGMCVAKVRSLYDRNDGMFPYKGGRILKSIFPTFEEDLGRSLISRVAAESEDDIAFVMAVVKNYDGDPAIQDVCKCMIEKLPEDSALVRDMFHVLSATGVVSGEYGLAESYERKISEIQAWKDDQSPKVRDFANEYIAYLEERAAWERTKARDEIKLRKFQYGATDGDDDGEDK